MSGIGVALLMAIGLKIPATSNGTANGGGGTLTSIAARLILKVVQSHNLGKLLSTRLPAPDGEVDEDYSGRKLPCARG